MRAPLLIMAGENDSRCPIRQVWNYVGRLRARGIEPEVYTYATGHSSFDVEERVRQTAIVLDFLARDRAGDRAPRRARRAPRRRGRRRRLIRGRRRGRQSIVKWSGRWYAPVRSFSSCISTSLRSDEAPNRNRSGVIQRGPSVSYRTTR